MKTNLLKIGRVLSATLFVLLLNVAGMTNAFAQTQVATLQHGDDISVFYGPNALIQANDAAVTNDIITLSSGVFNTCYISKSITLRGAGAVNDTVNNTLPTIVSGKTYLLASTCNIEGIRFDEFSIGCYNALYYQQHVYTINAPKFTKCCFSKFYCLRQYTSDYGNFQGYMHDGQFFNCKIGEFSCQNTYNTSFINSVICKDISSTDDNNQMLYNSIYVPGGNSTPTSITAYNSIIYFSNYSLNAKCSFYNCIGVPNFGDAVVENCITYGSISDVFENTIDCTVEESYILKEEVSTSFLGNDGTQVGIYGGFLPFNNRPSYMVLKHCNVANKSTIDGKLSVDIEVIYDGE